MTRLSGRTLFALLVIFAGCGTAEHDDPGRFTENSGTGSSTDFNNVQGGDNLTIGTDDPDPIPPELNYDINPNPIAVFFHRTLNDTVLVTLTGGPGAILIDPGNYGTFIFCVIDLDSNVTSRISIDSSGAFYHAVGEFPDENAAGVHLALWGQESYVGNECDWHLSKVGPVMHISDAPGD